MAGDNLQQIRLNVDPFLTTLSLGISPDQDFIGDMIFPVLPIVTDHVQIAKWGAEAFALYDDDTGDRGTPRRLKFARDKTTIEVEGHALETEATPREQQAAQNSLAPYDLLAQQVYLVTQGMLLRREYLQSALAQNGSVYGANTATATVQLGGKFTDGSVDPLVGLFKLINFTIPQGCGKRPNLFWFALDSWVSFATNPLVLQHLFGGVNPQPMATEQQIANILGIAKVIVGKAVTRNSDLTVATNLWTGTAGLLFVPPVAGVQIPAFGYTVEQGVFNGNSVMVTRYHDATKGPAGVDVAKRGAYYTPSVLFAPSAFLLTACI